MLNRFKEKRIITLLLIIFLIIVLALLYFLFQDLFSSTNVSIRMVAKISMPEISISASGDVISDREVKNLLLSYGPEALISDVRSIFSSSDLGVVNLESPLSESGQKLAWKDVTFRGTPQLIEALKLANINVVSLANNHALDCGPDAFLDTIARLNKSGIYHAGGGENIAEANKPALVDIKGQKIAFLSYSDILPSSFPAGEETPGIASARDLKKVGENIKEAKKKADLVIVAFHWGFEYKEDTHSSQRELARVAVDNGASLVLGHHPHVLQGLEIYKNSLIAYSLGDFIFDHYSVETGETIILKVTFSQEKIKKIDIFPVYLTSQGKPELIYDNHAYQILKRLDRLSSVFKTRVSIKEAKGEIQIN